jgi:hypothetical protein
VHPVHTEAVSWIAGRADLLAAFFGLLAIGPTLERRRRWLALPADLPRGLRQGERGYVSLLILFTAWSVHRRAKAVAGEADRATLRFALLSFIPVLVFLAIRRAVMGTWSGPTPDPLDNPLAGTTLFQRLPTILEIAGRAMLLLIWPARLSVDYSVPVIRVTGHPGALRFWAPW